MSDDDLLTPEQVGRMLSLQPATVLRLPIARVKLGQRTIRYRPDVVRAYIAEREEKSAA